MRIRNSFIPVRGVGATTERRMWENGIREWAEFRVDRAPGVGATTASRIESFVDEASERLDDGDARFFDERFPSGERWRLYEDFRDGACFFDIETTGLSPERDRVTTVSFHRDGETTTLVQGEDLSAEAVRAQFDAADLLVTFNGARFDVPFLETSLGTDVDTPHLDLMYPCKKIGLSGGLKPIEKELGIARDGPEITGHDAVRLWHEYERGDERALERLVSYNRDDTVNLRTLADIVAGRLHRETVPDDDPIGTSLGAD
ncbi:ribonuclease H-like domain-containing protein [Halobaculum lipolyticum]|uniref:Ribonuclease H-like domain-containing protein n=1 Tax=Halobaculum lipolyticum TaxID=3032001 RepID=A0ABD5WAD9_9EURY|nr:ribonuclease H-like domain-containing protein [Halobaculum sp. DT31]